MTSTKYVWARTFLTLFLPLLHNSDWMIRRHLTKYYSVRDIIVPINKWIKYQMWCKDKLSAKHPTFFLVLHNYNGRRQLQVQCRVIINTSDLDVNITTHDISRILNDDTQQQNKVGIRKHSKDFTPTQSMSLVHSHIVPLNVCNIKPYSSISHTLINNLQKYSTREV